MPDRIKKLHPALKHAGYSTTGVLPGEEAAEFDQLYRDLIADLRPVGVLEGDIVARIAGLVWRRQNLETFRIAELARRRCEQIAAENAPAPPFNPCDLEQGVDLCKQKAAFQAAEDQARKELADTYALVEVGATTDRLMRDLDVQDRLDASIDKCLKRLVLVRGVKSISNASFSAPPERLPGPSRAA
jgi:hypothetical protein